MPEKMEFTVNGEARTVAVAPDTPLLHVLRNHLGLRGSRFGCGLEQCGSCMVLIDGEPIQSCTRAMDAVSGRSVQTVEGLDDRLRQTFMDEQAGQCGYCLSGILISAQALLNKNSNPSRADIVASHDDNLCRCGAHVRIIRAVERAAQMLRGESAS